MQLEALREHKLCRP